jgi:uridine phosphorylase
MSFPLFPGKHKLQPMLTAEHMVEFRRKQGGLGDLPAPEGAVLCLYTGVMKRFAWKYPSRRVRGFLGDFYLLKRTRGRVGVLGNFGIGAPGLASLAEELMAWGTKRLAILSLAGGLQPDLTPGSILVCDRALRDEGTSYHYLPPGREVGASPTLVAAISQALSGRGLPHTTGATWSTDAPYRETRQEAETFQREGVQAVDMESAGLFAVGQVRGVETASVFVIGDSLASPRWSAPPDMRRLHQRLEVLLDVLIQVLRPGEQP